MQNNWTTDQVLGLSPDHFTIRSGRGNAKPAVWKSLGTNNALVWGLFDNKKRPPFEVCLLLNHMYFSCTCSSRKFPCPHIIGLYLLWQESPTLISQKPVPKWVRASQTRYLQMWHQQLEPSQRIDKETLAELHQGISDLERWLTDLMQDGIAGLPEKPKIFWETIANRLADVQAMALVKQLLDLIQIGQSKPDWPEHYLRRLSPLALLITSFKRFDEQTPTRQADLLGAIGRPFPLQYNGGSAAHDQWLVLGHHHESVGQHQQMFSWLYGLDQKRLACLTQTIRGKHPASIKYLTGSTLSSEFQFALSEYPLQGHFVSQPIIRPTPTHQIGATSILTAVQQFSHARSKNPWLPTFPLLLRGCLPLWENGRWVIIDQDQIALSLPHKFNYGWHLQALSCGNPLSLFGLWDGQTFQPLSVKIDGRWVDLHTFRGIK